MISRFTNLPTHAELHARPRAIPKPNTRLERAIATKAARLLDERKLRQWASAVKERDHWKDRHTGVKVYRTLSLDPRRAEAHHVEGKEDQAVRYDVRNGICLSFETHDAITRGALKIEGTVFFTVGGVTYIDATHDVRFV